MAAEVSGDVARFEVLIVLARVNAELGRHAYAARALAQARAVANRTPAPTHPAAIIGAEVALATAAGDVASVPGALARLHTIATAERADEPLRAVYAQAALDAVEACILTGETSAGERILRAMDGAVGEDVLAPAAARARRLCVRAGLHFTGIASLPLARSEAIEAYRLAQESADVRLTWEALHVLVDNHFDSLDLASVLSYGHLLLDHARALGDPRLVVRATLLVVATEAQQQRFAEALERLSACRPLAAGALGVLCDLAEAHVQHCASHHERALAQLDAAGMVARSERLTFLSAIVELYRGRAHAALGNVPAAVAAIESALELFAPDPHPYYLERGNRHLFRLTGRREYLDRAVGVAAHIRETTLPQPLAAQGVKNPARADGHIAGRMMLTRRQTEIAELVRQGLTNRAIATRLGISERTVAHHVEAVLARMGLRARWQIPARSDFR